MFLKCLFGRDPKEANAARTSEESCDDIGQLLEEQRSTLIVFSSFLFRDEKRRETVDDKKDS